MATSLDPERIVLLSAVTLASGTGTSRPVNVLNRDEICFYLQSNGVTSGGTILIEEADYDPAGPNVYTGTWGVIQTIAASTFAGGAQLPVHISPNAYSYVRARVSADITGGGSVTVTLKLQ